MRIVNREVIVPIRTGFHDRRGLPSRSKRKLPENRLHWRCSELLNPLMTAAILGQASRVGIIQQSQGARRKASKTPSSKVEIARRGLLELEGEGCDRHLILGITYLLAFGHGPEIKRTRWEAKDRALELVRSLRQVTVRMRHHVAFHAATTYDQRDWWLLQSLPDLLEEYQITVKKVSAALRSKPPMLRRRFWLLWLAQHLKEKTGRTAWEPIAAIIEGWLDDKPHQAFDALSLEKSYLRACQTSKVGKTHPAESSPSALQTHVQEPSFPQT